MSTSASLNTKRALAASKVQGIDVLILDTAGRTILDNVMMTEAKEPTNIFNKGDKINRALNDILYKFEK